MSSPSRMCGLDFYPALSLANDDHNKEYPMTKFKQFSKFGLVEISSQRLKTSICIWNW